MNASLEKSLACGFSHLQLGNLAVYDYLQDLSGIVRQMVGPLASMSVR